MRPARATSRTAIQTSILLPGCLAVVLSSTATVQLQAKTRQTAMPDSVAYDRALAFAIDSTDEGPHIYWRDESTAFVFYLCDGNPQYRGQRVADSLVFDGFCDDSETRYAFASSPPSVEPHVFDDVERILTVSDIHGEYDALVDLLKNAGVIDKRLHWSWDEGHLVVLGDVFDRGARVTECLWLIHRLEREARSSGGRVHFTLGNHEKMALRGDLRYVNMKYMLGIADRTDIPYDDLFGPHTELGRWLRTKHTALRLNDILFVHGGFSPEVVERGLTLDSINEAVRKSLDYRSYELLFSDLEWFLLSSAGPLWYRGYHQARSGYSRASEAQLDTILGFYDAEAIVVGHHEVGQVTSWYQGRVYGVDVPVPELGGLQALLWEDGEFSRVLGSGRLEPLIRP